MPISHTVKHRDGGTVTFTNLTPRKAIRIWCTECQGWESHPNTCTIDLCPLFPYKGKDITAIRKKV